MKPGYARVSKEAENKAAGKIRKILCECTDGPYNGRPSTLYKEGKLSFFNHGEAGDAVCKVCGVFRWYKI